MQAIKTIIIGLLICWECSHVRAQVTVGSMEEPVTGAILDLKTQLPTIANNNVTSERGGLVLPRVELQNKTTLEPFISSLTDDIKREHIGLLVYNVKDDNIFHPGIYVWKENSWEPVPEGYIQLPAFNLPWATLANVGRFNLFEEVYKKNLTPTNNISSGDITAFFPPYEEGKADDFYYVVTDPTVYNIVHIDKQGVMTYYGNGSRPAPEGNNLRINVVMIKK